MIRGIVTRKDKLSLQSEEIYEANKIELIITDLIDTAKHNAKHPPGCIGLAANQIGELHRVIVIFHGGKWVPMINPVLETEKGPMGYAKEGCLSRPGIHTKKRRYKKIRVSYEDQAGITRQEKYSGLTARVIQHELAHLDGLFI